jgi:hypothetical protein
MAYQDRAQEISPGRVVGWIVIGSLMFWPRLFLLAFWIFYRAIFDAFDTWVVPFIGFVVLPWTTLAYAAMWGVSSDRVSGFEWVVVGVALAMDLVAWSWVRR